VHRKALLGPRATFLAVELFSCRFAVTLANAKNAAVQRRLMQKLYPGKIMI
jgi:hypothetical protein